MCDRKVVAFAVKPVTRPVTEVIDQLSKFEHPIPPLAPPPASPEKSFPNFSAVRDILSRKLPAINRPLTGKSAGDRTADVTICVPLYDVSPEKADQLAEALHSSPHVISAKFDIASVTEHVATLIFSMRVAERPT